MYGVFQLSVILPTKMVMAITFNIPELARNDRNFHCDLLHITPVRVARLVLDDAFAAIQTSQ